VLKSPSVFWFAVLVAALVVLYLLTRRPPRDDKDISPEDTDHLPPPPSA
jgi:hypothetical protein